MQIYSDPHLTVAPDAPSITCLLVCRNHHFGAHKEFLSIKSRVLKVYFADAKDDNILANVAERNIPEYRIQSPVGPEIVGLFLRCLYSETPLALLTVESLTYLTPLIDLCRELGVTCLYPHLALIAERMHIGATYPTFCELISSAEKANAEIICNITMDKLMLKMTSDAEQGIFPPLHLLSRSSLEKLFVKLLKQHTNQ